MRSPAPILSGALIATAFIAVLDAATPVYASDATFFGTGIGAAVGGLFGSQIGHGSGQLVATGVGVAAGGLIGNEVGHEMDAESPHYASGGPSMIYSEPAPVYNTYTPNYVAPPAPPPTYVDQSAGTYCRLYSQEIMIDGAPKESYGTACLQPDGSWRIVP